LLSGRLDNGGVGSFVRLTPLQQGALTRLTERSRLSLRVDARGGRVLIALPPEHPAGPLELLLAEDQDRLFVFVPKPRLRLSLPMARLPDILDGVTPSARTDFAMELEGAPEPARRRREHHKIRDQHASITLSYFPDPQRADSWSIQHRLTLAFLDRPRPFYTVFQQPLLHVALPLLQTSRGRLALESLAFATGTPTGWSLTLINEGHPGGTPPTLHVTAHDRGWNPVPARAISIERQGFRPGRTMPRSVPGMQLTAGTALADLRSGKSEGPLAVHNRSGCSAYLYADGVLLGWVGPGSQFSFAGLPAGYWRIYAVSPTGLRYWGPHDLYVPGPLTLR